MTLPLGAHVEMIDPAGAERDEAVHGAGDPDLALRKHAIPEEREVFFGRMQLGQIRQARGAHGAKQPRHRRDIPSLACLMVRNAASRTAAKISYPRRQNRIYPARALLAEGRQPVTFG